MQTSKFFTIKNFIAFCNVVPWDIKVIVLICRSHTNQCCTKYDITIERSCIDKPRRMNYDYQKAGNTLSTAILQSCACLVDLAVYGIKWSSYVIWPWLTKPLLTLPPGPLPQQQQAHRCQRLEAQTQLTILVIFIIIIAVKARKQAQLCCLPPKKNTHK
jgi:hypothetical protein